VGGDGGVRPAPPRRPPPPPPPRTWHPAAAPQPSRICARPAATAATGRYLVPACPAAAPHPNPPGAAWG
jgi:hypothetical protein